MRVCEVDGCARRHVARGWCRHHYQSWLRHGDPTVAREHTPVAGLYTSSDVLQRLPGITYRQLDYWTREGWITPSHPSEGSGQYRYWSEIEVEALGAILRLVAQMDDVTSGAMWSRLTADEASVSP